MLTVSRDRLVSVFLAGILGGVVLTWACGPGPIPDANAQDALPTPDCARFEILPIIVNTEENDESALINEPLALGWPVALPPQDVGAFQIPQTIDEAKIVMPDGWEPIGAYGNFFMLRRCVL